MNTLTLTFADSADMANFLRYVDRAKTSDGTVGGLYAGLVCSALKRAQVGEATAPALLAALEAMLFATAKADGQIAKEARKIAVSAIAAAKGGKL